MSRPFQHRAENRAALSASDPAVRHALGLVFAPEPAAWVHSANEGGERAGRTCEPLWEEILAVLEEMRLGNWVWHRLSRPDASTGRGLLPPAAAAALSRAHLGATARNMILLDAFDTFMAEAGRRAIAVAPLKGAALLTGPLAIYEDLGARSTSDIDLFCPPGRLDEASALLEGMGFSLAQSALDAMRLGHHRHFSKSLGGRVGEGQTVTLELHYRLNVWWWGLGALDREFSAALEGRGGMRWSGPVASGWVERHLVHLCLHLLKHGMGPDLRNAVDLVELARRHPPDWDLVHRIADRARLWPTVMFILDWIAETLLAPVGAQAPWADSWASPGFVSRSLRHPLDGLGQARSLARLLPLDRIPPTPDSLWTRVTAKAHLGSLNGPEKPMDVSKARILLYVLLLPSPVTKAASVTWWFWDHWNLRKLLPKGGPSTGE